MGEEAKNESATPAPISETATSGAIVTNPKPTSHRLGIEVATVSFIILVAILYSMLIMGIRWAGNRIEPEKRTIIGWIRVLLGGFLLVTGILAIDEVFLDFESVPPPIVIAIAVSILGFIVLGSSQAVGRWLREIPQTWLIGVQSFRIVVEFQLYALALTPLLPKMMTFEGSNFDILTGLTALPVAFWVRSLDSKGKTAESKVIVRAWNILGLILLVNVAGHGLLSAPTAFRQIFTEPSTSAIGTFPFIWLPTFVVPFAGLLHVLSIRKTFQPSSPSRTV